MQTIRLMHMVLAHASMLAFWLLRSLRAGMRRYSLAYNCTQGPRVLLDEKQNVIDDK